MDTILEIKLIERLAADMPRSKLHVGHLQESDAELIRLPGSDILLAITTDAIVEEIELGLYDDPYLIGWMAVLASASDLAAVGAEPLGILMNESIPSNMAEDEVSELQRGIREACRATGLPVLGGDTNTARTLQVAATAVGIVNTPPVITRMGCRTGDVVFASGPLGLGSCYAFRKLSGIASSALVDVEYLPEPRFRQGSIVRSLASACMDTSDGALATIDQLMRLNQVGFVLHDEAALHPSARRLAEQMDLPAWMMLAGLHGEFELLFTVSPDRVGELLRKASLESWSPIEIGHVVSTPGVWLQSAEGRGRLDTGRIRNVFAGHPTKIGACIQQLKMISHHDSEELCTH